MSAYVVDKASIDALVAVALEAGAVVTPEPLDADRIGDALVWECVRSVAYRYPDDSVLEGQLPGPCEPYYLAPYVFPHDTQAPPASETLDILGSYEYQSCEHPQWGDSDAAILCAMLREWLKIQPPPPAPPAPDPAVIAERYGDLSRAETIKRIRQALKRRSGKTWSVTGGRGTAWGWISISAPPKRLHGYGYMTETDCVELADLLGKDRPVHMQGESIPSSGDYYREYIDRAEGRDVETFGKQYWD
jgi:hypothetical protein